MPNFLYYGDNLDVLRRHVKDESVDLVYLDPPFNSSQNYNVLFAEKTGSRSAAQIRAFEDSWHWDDSAERAYQEIVEAGGKISQAMQAFRTFLGENDMMAYLAMMAPRMVELRRVLKLTGSIYLHCDPTASHYLKMLMDGIFGPKNYRNEISWKRSNPKSHAKINFPNCRDVILRYSKGTNTTFTMIYEAHDPEYIRSAYKYSDMNGRYRLLPLLNPNDNRPNLTYEFLGVTRVWRWTRERMERSYRDGLVVQLKPGAVPQYKKYLAESNGRTITDDWGDIEQAAGNEALGYPTQKPEALLERIINASSNEGDTVLDPFCGCGTTISVAQRLNRRWIGIDITHLAISLMKHRLKTAFGDAETPARRPQVSDRAMPTLSEVSDRGVKFKVIGEPTDQAGAAQIAADDPYQFQFWALGLVGARPAEEKKGADKGIDGRIYFHDEGATGTTKQIVLSVKGGKTSSPHVRDLLGVLDREKAQIGVLITLQEPTRDMKTEAVKAGFYESPWGKHPRCQVLTIAELLGGAKIDAPPIGRYAADATLKAAPKVKGKGPENAGLFGEGNPRKRFGRDAHRDKH